MKQSLNKGRGKKINGFFGHYPPAPLNGKINDNKT